MPSKNKKRKDDLTRVNALWALNKGMPQKEVAKRFGVQERTLRRWKYIFEKEDGRVTPGKSTGRKPGQRKELHEAIVEMYKHDPTLTPEDVERELGEKISRRGIQHITQNYGVRKENKNNKIKKEFRKKQEKEKQRKAKNVDFCMMDLID